ncbi:uncharacterized protein LOC111872895 isoform X2 [Cryptotermes secundus]|uniref:uncharacterized protein LOC111872895 isoform X2 n=1 Tax=Cryptotermes secundus TaxID=105785 RepID=UPI000CD7B483|nr:uncharacterized protein LOC111872895 isoform X2 [Cryptotermes secundus]
MDDLLDEFTPLTMTGISPRSRRNDISLSQVSSISRLSQSYIKSKKKSGCKSKSNNGNNLCHSSTAGTMTTTGDTYKSRDTHLQASADGVQFCPICQAPFDIIKVDPCVHVNQCNVTSDELEECPKGEICYNYNLLHYRDYAHKALAQIRASKGHLPQEPPWCTTPETVKRVGGETEQFLQPFTPLSSNKKLKRTSSDVARGHHSARQRRLFIDEQAYAPGRDDTVTSLSQKGDKKNAKTEVHKCSVNQSYNENGSIETVNHMTEDPNLEERSNKDLEFYRENLEPVIEMRGSEESKTSIIPALDYKCKRSERTCANSYSCECNRKLKLDGAVEYATHKLDKQCDENRNVRTGVLPYEAKSDPGCLHEVSATMSVVLQPSEGNSVDGGDKLKAPVKVDASCGEEGWETVGISALPDAEVGDVMVSVCKCAKTMHLNCTLSHKHTVTNFSGETDTKSRELESKFFSNVNKLELPYKMRQKDTPGSANRQMSITSYFRLSHLSSSRSLHIPAEGSSKNVKSSSSSFAVPQDCHCFEQNSSNTAGKECLQSSSKPPKQSKESVAAYWKELLSEMKQKGLSTMSVMSDDTMTVASDGCTSGSNSYSLQQSQGKKTCPSYKRIPAALVKMKLRVDERYLHVLELDNPQKINGVLVTALDANHCPGSVMFLFQLQDGRNFLHVGDFRADPKMESYPCFWNLTIDKLYLDTTYCEPQYSFPMQSETVARVVELAVEHCRVAPATLFVCGTYTLGKEKVFLGIVEALNCKLWAHPDKRKVLECIDDEIINKRLTNMQWDAQVHVCRMSDLNISFLQRYWKQHRGVFTHIVAFRPTGWETRCKNKTSDVNVTSNGNITIYGIPYSEHSSFTELRRFVQFLKPAEIIPTVNVERSAKRNAMMKYFRQWLSEPSVPSLKRKREGDQYVQQKMTLYSRSPRLGDR